jgi:transposase
LSRSPGTHQEEGTIPQALLPLIAEGATRISDIISVVRENGQWTYFCGVQPVFQHAENDHRSFRMFTAQLICQGVCRQVDILRAFGISKNSVNRSVKTYRAGGVSAFYTPRATRGASVMTPEVAAQAQQLLGAGWSPREVAERLGIKLDTLRKAIQHGRLTVPCPVKPGEPAPEEASVPPPPTATDKSTRAVEDAAAEMGTACTRPDERVLAAFGLLDGAPTRFETCRDVPFGGVLCACPPWRRMACFDTSTIAWHGCAATTVRCT